MKVLKMVLAGEARHRFDRSLNHPGVETLTVRVDPLILIRPKWGGCRSRKSSPGRWYFTTAGRVDGFSTSHPPQEASFCRASVLEFEAIEAAKRMVERKVGVCFRPWLAVTEELDCDRSRFREMAIAVAANRQSAIDDGRAARRRGLSFTGVPIETQ